MAKEKGQELEVVVEPAEHRSNLPAVPSDDPSQYPPDEELPLPRLSIIQAMSDAAADNKPGLFYNNLTGETYEKITGVILGMGLSRVLGVKKGEQPLCRSFDNVHGDGEPGGECVKCLNSQWDRDKVPNVPPECRQNYDLLFFDEAEMPYIYQVYKTAIKPANYFIAAARSRNLPLYCFRVEITVKQIENDQGKFFVPYFRVTGQTNPTEWQRYHNDATRLLAVMRRQAVAQPVDTPPEEPVAPEF